MVKWFLVFFVPLVVAVFLLVGSCFALVTVPVFGDGWSGEGAHVGFGYGNGTYYFLSGSTNQSFTRIERVDNVWHFYPQVTEGAETEAERLKYQMSWLLFALAVVSIVVIFLPWRLWLLRVGLGLFVIVIAGAGVFRLSNWWDIMFAPWLQIAVIFLGVVLIISSFSRRE